jgi:hypothetical protein
MARFLTFIRRKYLRTKHKKSTRGVNRVIKKYDVK